MLVVVSCLYAVYMAEVRRSCLSARAYVSLTTSAASMPRLKLLVTGLSPRKPGFNTTPIHVDKVALRQAFLRALSFR
jgi:hypothetical protein